MHNPCPNFTRIFWRLWHSPTFTTWGNQAVQALRLLAVTPLILVSFNTTEIAAWYLFGSLTFFGTIISQRVGLTFSRMIAFAMGGAADLSPIKGKVERRPDAAPNWPVIERAYATTGALNALLTVVIVAIALGMGWYGLENMLSDYPDAGTVWAAFGVMILTQSAVFFFQRYQIALKGMNYVALSNRWDVVFSLISVGAGVAVLQAGCGILAVTCTMQGVILLSILRNRFLLRSVEAGRFKGFRTFRLDRQMLGWAWEPAWKGFVVNMANSGSIQIAAILSARFLSVAESASLLLTMRLLNTFKTVSDSPFTSHMPRIARLFAEGRKDILGVIVPRKMLMCQLMLGMFTLGLALLGPPVLEWIGSNASLIAVPHIALFGLGFILVNSIRLPVILAASGNHIICVRLESLTFVVRVISLFILIPLMSDLGVILGLFIPMLVLLNVIPARIAAKKIGVSFPVFSLKFLLWPSLLPFLAYLIAVVQDLYISN